MFKKFWNHILKPIVIYNMAWFGAIKITELLSRTKHTS